MKLLAFNLPLGALRPRRSAAFLALPFILMLAFLALPHLWAEAHVGAREVARGTASAAHLVYGGLLALALPLAALAGYLLGWLLNALACLLLGWPLSRVAAVFLRSELPAAWWKPGIEPRPDWRPPQKNWEAELAQGPLRFILGAGLRFGATMCAASLVAKIADGSIRALNAAGLVLMILVWAMSGLVLGVLLWWMLRRESRKSPPLEPTDAP